MRVKRPSSGKVSANKKYFSDCDDETIEKIDEELRTVRKWYTLMRKYRVACSVYWRSRDALFRLVSSSEFAKADVVGGERALMNDIARAYEAAEKFLPEIELLGAKMEMEPSDHLKRIASCRPTSIPLAGNANEERVFAEHNIPDGKR